jgi:hypothetical protein
VTLSPKTDTTILLDIYERLGTIEQQLRTLAEDHKDMEEELDELKDLKSRMGAYIWLGGAIVSGAFLILAQGAKWALDRWFH